MSTIVGIATAPGIGGIGIIRMSGEKTFEILDKIFIPKTKQDISEIKGYSIKYGNVVENNKIIDEVLVSYFKTPKSYTTENMCEINAHGGNIVVKKILELCLANGAEMAGPGEFTKRAFLNGRIDLAQAESVIDVINAKSEREAKSGIKQLEGFLSTEINQIKQDILDVLVNIEVTIDYPEYDTPEVQENELKNIEKSLSSIKELSKEIKKEEHELSLLDEINKLIMGNKFVEYVATNQLKYIALEASKRLSAITRGRYALEIDENLNFIMRDNMNGGQRRSVDSLSGGETFLTSLSLALALSSQIQLKGNNPLEFFFLDEGFGSLDTDLLDVVMESLENLHSDNLSIGIISHVEELKNRVPVKLLVTPCDVGTGSKVKIEYS